MATCQYSLAIAAVIIVLICSLPATLPARRRSGEVRNLQLKDIDLGQGKVRIVREVAKNRREREPRLMALAEWGLRNLLLRAQALGAIEPQHYLLPLSLSKSKLAAADQINQQIQSAAPGSAPILEAQAAAWNVRANAYTQSAMAELMRVRSMDLANSSAHVKLSAASNHILRNTTDRILGQTK